MNVLLKSQNMRYLGLMIVLNLLSGCGVTNRLSARTDPPNAVVDQFMHELFQKDRDLLRDEKFKQKYFSQQLRRAFDKANKKEGSSPPDRFNTMIFDAWSTPTTYTMGEIEQKTTTATVQVTYLWGPDTQYSGDKRFNSVQLVAEDGSWRIDDIFNRKSDFHSEGSVRSSLEKSKEN